MQCFPGKKEFLKSKHILFNYLSIFRVPKPDKELLTECPFVVKANLLENYFKTYKKFALLGDAFKQVKKKKCLHIR